jgi:hypothetical protein
MDPSVAQRIARASHGPQRDRFGDPAIDHVERVAAAVPADARATALLLTRAPDESFELQVLTIEHTWVCGTPRAVRQARRLERPLGARAGAGGRPPLGDARPGT